MFSSISSKCIISATILTLPAPPFGPGEMFLKSCPPMKKSSPTASNFSAMRSSASPKSIPLPEKYKSPKRPDHHLSRIPPRHPRRGPLQALETIQAELKERAAFFEKQNKLLEKQRILERTKYDLEMIREIGFCKGIENYSRHFSGRSAGDPPPCLLDYFPRDFLLFVDESHQTLPQLHAMYNGDRAAKTPLSNLDSASLPPLITDL